MKTHELKTNGTCWDAVKAGLKTWEIRFNDRSFQSGDIVRLTRLNSDNRPMFGESYVLTRRVGWMLTGGHFGVPAGHVIFSLEPHEDPTP